MDLNNPNTKDSLKISDGYVLVDFELENLLETKQIVLDYIEDEFCEQCQHTSDNTSVTLVDGYKQFIQPASIDIPVGSICYLLKDRFLPNKTKVEDLVDLMYLEKIDFSKASCLLLKGQTYLFPCAKINLKRIMRGILSPKSSIGRIDVMVRGIIDYCGLYDVVDGNGQLWLEVTPRSFNIKIRPGTPISQLMIFDRYVTTIHHTYEGIVVYDLGQSPIRPLIHRGELVLSLNLNYSSDNLSSVCKRVGFKALSMSSIIDLNETKKYSPKDFFTEVYSTPTEIGEMSITLEKDQFYIFATKERIRIPTFLSAEMVPFSHHVGELRAHYAGFFDPGFGFGEKGEVNGTVGVLEIRPHETITIYDGQPICLMRFYKNTFVPTKPYGAANNHYQFQKGPKLAKFFNDE